MADYTVSISQNEYTAAQLEQLHTQMNARALRRRRIRQTVLVALNIVMALFMLFPLLYAVSVSIMLALARAIVVIASDGRILDTVLHSIAQAIGQLHPLAAVEGMFWAHTFINFFVASGSGQAVLTMPVMIPLSDLLGISPQLSILAYQFGEGWTNAIIPTAPVTMAAIGMAGIPWLKWARWNIWLQVVLAVLSMLLLIPPFLMHW